MLKTYEQKKYSLANTTHHSVVEAPADISGNDADNNTLCDGSHRDIYPALLPRQTSQESVSSLVLRTYHRMCKRWGYGKISYQTTH